jgi:putative PIN family toxin of toxin-antitoxin system
VRVVIDTGVLISAALKAETAPSLAVHQAARHGTLLKSSATEAEFQDVLVRPYLARLIAPAARIFLMQLMAGAESVPIDTRVVACRDAKDDKFLELAVNGAADVLVSGDKDLLVLNPFRGIPILAPAPFLLTPTL